MSGETTKSNYRDTLISPNAPASEAIGILENSKQKVCLVVDEVDTLLGTVTDGDIRRGILANISFNRPKNGRIKGRNLWYYLGLLTSSSVSFS